MATTYTRRLGATHQQAAGGVVLFEADDQATYVIRDICLGNDAAATATLQAYLFSGGVTLKLFSASLATLETAHLELRQVIQPGEAISAFSDSTNWSVVVTGYALTPT